MGVEIYPGLPRRGAVDDSGSVKGIATGEMGVGAGVQKDSYVPSMELHARYTILPKAVAATSVSN